MSESQFRLLSALTAAQAAAEPVALATIVRSGGSVPRHPGTKMLVFADGRTLGTIGGGEMEARVSAAAAETLQNGRPRLYTYSLVDPKRGDPGVCGGEVDIFIEPYLPLPALLIAGCGHVGQALAHVAHWLGYQVIVTDDREELATPQHVPDADVYLPGPFAQAITQHPITANTYVTLVTRNVEVDRQIIPHLLASPAPYIGVMGSQRRWAETRRLLLADGVAEADLERIVSPLGLELEAETPAEIAISIMAEITMLRRGGDGKRMGQ